MKVRYSQLESGYKTILKSVLLRVQKSLAANSKYFYVMNLVGNLEVGYLKTYMLPRIICSSYDYSLYKFQGCTTILLRSPLRIVHTFNDIKDSFK